MIKVFEKVFGAVVVAASGSIYSKDIDVSERDLNWVFGFQGTVTGDGTATITYLTSIDGVTFNAVASHTSVVATQTKTSGPASNGKILAEFAEAPLSCRFLRLKLTEAGGANGVTLSLDVIAR